LLITVSGIDCSGKSTQIEHLREYLRDRGLKTQTFWYRPGYSNELDAIRALIRSLRPDLIPEAGRSAERQRAFETSGVSETWIAVALLDMFWQYCVKLRLMLKQYDCVICDRYLADAALDFALKFPERDVSESDVFRLIEFLAPTPVLQLMLVIPHDVMLDRMEEKEEPFPDPPKLRDARFDAYSALSRRPVFVEIDASRSISDVRTQVLDELRRVEMNEPPSAA
jgi:thymidylate kinase